MTSLHDRADARNSEVTPTFTVVSTAAHDRAWWTEESARGGTGWPAIIDAALEIMVAAGVIRPEQSTFELACEQADRKRQPHPSRQGVAMGAPAATVEALVFSLRDGIAALGRSATLRRLSELSPAQLREVAVRVQKFKPEIAQPWTPQDVEVLIGVRSRLHA
jgi:hypothetical protein